MAPTPRHRWEGQDPQKNHRAQSRGEKGCMEGEPQKTQRFGMVGGAFLCAPTPQNLRGGHRQQQCPPKVKAHGGGGPAPLKTTSR